MPTPPFNKVLVANRGEIAIRVMRTCREARRRDRRRLLRARPRRRHVRYADEAYALGGQTAAESYLNTGAILDVIARSGAEAVHPGYGFFAENADFARADHRSGRHVDRAAAGARSRSWATRSRRARRPQRAGVEAVPGTLEPITSADQVVAFGEQHGWPVAIKAAFGGGGPGHEGRRRPRRGPVGARLGRARGAGVLRPARDATSSGTSPGPATSRCRCSPTRRATPCGSASATARRSAATRSSSRRRRRRALADDMRRQWAKRR